MAAFRGPDFKTVTEGGIGRKKPAKGARRRGRVTASRDQWLDLRLDKLDQHECRICRNAMARELHHLVPRSLGGGDVADNLVGLDRGCHELVTLRDPDALAALAESLTDAEYAYCIEKLGEGAMQRLFGVYHDSRPQAGVSEVPPLGAA